MKSEKRKMKNEGARLPVQINPAQGAAPERYGALGLQKK